MLTQDALKLMESFNRAASLIYTPNKANEGFTNLVSLNGIGDRRNTAQRQTGRGSSNLNLRTCVQRIQTKQKKKDNLSIPSHNHQFSTKPFCIV